MIIHYGGAVINLDKFVHALVTKYDLSGGYEKRWRVDVKMEGGAEFAWRGFKTEADAEAKMEDFYQAIQRTQYTIHELIP